jgi:methionyl-tRNA formyltransferase
MSFKVVFMGTPDFAVHSLKTLHENGIEIAGVVTATDKPAGRGQKLTPSPIKQYAEQHGLTVLQPEKLKDENFLQSLQNLHADLFVVVAFRMLPEAVWTMPPKGTINLHASLLPMYRGAAPINWAVMNGEKESGITTFFIRQEIDTGNIIAQEKVSIEESDNAGSLHDKLMVRGAELLLQTVRSIRDNTYSTIPQETLLAEMKEVKSAFKIFKEDCHLNWNHSTEKIHNLVRGLSPYPAAWNDLHQPGKEAVNLKIFKTKKTTGQGTPGALETDSKTYIKIFTNDGALLIEELQQAGKKRMHVEEFLRGTKPEPGSFLK